MTTQPDSTDDHSTEVAQGERFEFGANWARFLHVLSDRRIGLATQSLRDKLGDLTGKTFIDVGSGSGLSSLAAMRLGAARVHSFDYDPQSVACTRELRRRYYADADTWTVEEGSALDEAYLVRLGTFDVAYSWGVLHHTGAMWRALDLVTRLVTPGGRLFVAIYNDQGRVSDGWRALKRTYNRLPRTVRPLYTFAVFAPLELRLLLRALVKRQVGAYVRTWTRYDETAEARGMSRVRDMIDWIGGYPFEVASPQALADFYETRGFSAQHELPDRGSLGCNELVFRRH